MGRKKSKTRLTIGELGNIAKVSYGTIRYWTDEGLLECQQEFFGKRKYYDMKNNLDRIRKIKRMKKRRLTIEEIKQKMNMK